MIKCGLAYRSARERRRVAVHEAGHVVMARLFGLTLLRALIAPDEGSWHGSVQVAPVGQLHPRAVARMVGVAGKAAELCWTDRHYDVLDEDWWHPGTLSESDWAQTGCLPGAPDKAFFSALNQAAKLFRSGEGEIKQQGPLWGVLTQTAHVMTSNGTQFADWDVRLYRAADRGYGCLPQNVRRSLRSYLRRQSLRDCASLGHPRPPL